MWDPVPRPAIELRTPALRAQSPSHWTTREVHLHIFLSNIDESCLYGSISGLYLPFHSSVYSHEYCSFIVILKVGCESSSFVLLLQNCQVQWFFFFTLLYVFQNQSVCNRKSCRGCDQNYSKSIELLERIDILTILGLLIHKQGISFHLLGCDFFISIL